MRHKLKDAYKQAFSVKHQLWLHKLKASMQQREVHFRQTPLQSPKRWCINWKLERF